MTPIRDELALIFHSFARHSCLITLLSPRVIAALWERDDIPTTKSDGAKKNMRSDDGSGCKQASSLDRFSEKTVYLEVQHDYGKCGGSKLRKEISQYTGLDVCRGQFRK